MLPVRNGISVPRRRVGGHISGVEARDEGRQLAIARSRGSRAEAILPSMRSALLPVDAQMAIADLRTLEASAARSIVTERYATLLLSVLAAAALTLSALGIYAVTSHVFLMRRHEMGIRLALGSSRSDLYRLVLGHAFRLTAIGLVLGAGIAALGTRWLESRLFSTSPADWAAWSTMAGVVLMSTLLTCAVPAWRTASTDPVSALRIERTRPASASDRRDLECLTPESR